MSATSTVPRQTGAVGRRWLIANPTRILKVGLAVVAVATGCYAILAQQGFIASENAVVSAYVIALRTPIEGYVSGERAVIGQEVTQGAVLATVTNPRVDDQHLQDLRDRLQRLELDRAAILRERDALRAMLADLRQRAETYRDALVARLSGQATATRMSLVADLAQREQARRDYARKAALVQSGAASLAELDRTRYAFERLDGEAQAQAGQLAAVQAQLDAAARGVTTDPGANDVAYSTQRADEVRIRLAELDRELDNNGADSEVARSLQASEAQRIALLHAATMSAPSTGMLWKVGASHGERLSTGDMTAELVDCRAAFLVATIPQNAYSHIALGSQARFRLAGETNERTGRVLSVTGDTSLIGDRNLAAVPATEHKPSAIVRIEVPASRNSAADCLVGRQARVLLPSAGDSVLDAAARLLQSFL